MRWYKGYSPEQRYENLERVKEAIENGILESPYNLKCEICGQDKGVREYHCYDYNHSVALQSLTCLCWKCHRNLHIVEIGPKHEKYEWAKRYFEKIKEGYRYSPKYTSYYTEEMEKQNEDRRNADLNSEVDRRKQTDR